MKGGGMKFSQTRVERDLIFNAAIFSNAGTLYILYEMNGTEYL